MSKIKKLYPFGLMLFVIILIAAVGYTKYYIWRAEHPDAKTWTFFIPKGR